MESEKVSVPRFSGRDFAVWKMQMKAILTAKDLMEVITGVKPGVASADHVKKDNQAKSLLVMALDMKHARLVLNCTTAKEIWDRLVSIHEQKSVGNKLVIQKEFFDLQMEPKENAQEYISRAEYVANQLKDIGVDVPDSILVGKIVSGLSREYSAFITSWMNLKEDDQTIDKLLPRLMAEETMYSRQYQEGSRAMAVESGRQHERQGELVKASSNNQGQQRGMNARGGNRRPPINCYNCGKLGHPARLCRLPNRNGNTAQSENDEDIQGVMAMAGSSASEKFWIIDSGATEHMTDEWETFSTYEAFAKPKSVLFCGRAEGRALGKGTIQIMSNINGAKTKFVMHDVLYVPEINRKLFSVTATLKQGNRGIFEDNRIVIKNKKGKSIIIAPRYKNLFRADIEDIRTGSMAASALSHNPDLSLWHERFAHLNKRTIETMVKEKSVLGLNCDVSKDPATQRKHIDCESCALGKQSKKTYPSSRRKRAETVGEVVHVDICGPFGTSTISGNRYFVLFKDEYSNYRPIYFIKGKDEVHDCIRRVVAQIESDTKHKVLKLFSDHGSELTSNKTKEFLLSKGITQIFAAPYTPQQIGFIERDNRTILEATRTMLFHRKLPEALWGEAAKTAVYLLNRTSNSNTGSQVPFERYFGTKPRVDHIRVFGSLASMKLQHKKRSGYQGKLEPRSKRTILVGYERDQTYRVYDPETKKVEITREVIIDEFKTIDDIGDGKYEMITLVLDSLPEETREDEPCDQPRVETSNISEEANERKDEEPDCEDYTSAHEQSMQIADEEDEEPPKTPTRSSSIFSFIPAAPQIPLPPIPPSNTLVRSLRPRREVDYSENRKRRHEGNVSEALLAYGDEPNNFETATSCGERDMWKKAMDEEFTSLIKNNTWILTELPRGRKPISCKWVFKTKRNTDGEIERYKARLVARGFSQKEGIDYTETFSPVVRMEPVRVLLSIVAQRDLEMIHFDVKTAFLNGNLKEEIYMEQPEGYKDGNKVCKLIKSLYGLKQASREWNICFTNFLKEFHLQPLLKDSCILVRRPPVGDKYQHATLIIAIYVDDGLACSDSKELLDEVVKRLKSRFEITIMDPKCYVGLQIRRNRAERSMFISQEYYVKKIIDRFEMVHAKPVSTPLQTGMVLCREGTNDEQDHNTVDVPYKQAIGSLMYASCGSRPDICHAVGLLSRFSEQPKLVHWNALKRVLRYLNGTMSFGIELKNMNDETTISCYTDADFAMDIDERKSTSGYVITMGGPVIWKSTKQKLVSTSTAEAEFIAASMACKDILWARQLLAELNFVQTKPTIMHVDNKAAICLIKSDQFHQRTKHIDINYMFVRSAQENGDIDAQYVESENNIADIFTKALARDRFLSLRNMLKLNVYVKGKKEERASFFAEANFVERVQEVDDDEHAHPAEAPVDEVDVDPDMMDRVIGLHIALGIEPHELLWGTMNVTTGNDLQVTSEGVIGFVETD